MHRPHGTRAAAGQEGAMSSADLLARGFVKDGTVPGACILGPHWSYCLPCRDYRLFDWFSGRDNFGVPIKALACRSCGQVKSADAKRIA
jgi:hypothetical protein